MDLSEESIDVEERAKSPLTMLNTDSRGSNGDSDSISDSVSISSEHSSPTMVNGLNTKIDPSHREILEKLKRQEIEERVEIERELKAHKEALARHEELKARERVITKHKLAKFEDQAMPTGPNDFISRDELLHRRPELVLYPGLRHEHLELLRAQQQAYLERAFSRSPPLNGITGHHESPSHHWTFEEQFKQLYELSDDPKRKEFLDDLFTFMQKRGTPVNRIPIMAKQTLDLYELFKLVASKGGLVEVINKKLWREITKGLNLPSSITSAAFTLRTQYMKYIYPYECEKLKLSTPQELQAAIDGNRREGRRPSYGYDLSPGAPTLLPPTPTLNGLNNTMIGYNGVHASQLNGMVNGGTKTNGSGHGSDDSLPSTPSHIRSPVLSERDAMAMEAASRAMEHAKRKLGRTSPTDDDAPLAKKKFGYSEEERLLAHAGMPSAHLKITSRNDGRTEFDNSLVVSMEVNGIMYQGVLFAQLPRKL